MKKERKHLSSRKGLANSILILLLTLWGLAMGLLSWAVASDFLQQVSDHTRQYALFQGGRLVSLGDLQMTVWEEESQRFVLRKDIKPEELEQSTVLTLESMYGNLEAVPLIPFPYEPVRAFSHDPKTWSEINGKYLYGFEVAACYVDEERGTRIESRDYFSLHPVEVYDVSYESLADFLDARMAREHSAYYGDDQGSWNKTVFSYQVHREDELGSYEFAIAVRCWPMTYTLIRMIPIYGISLAGLLLLWWLVQKSFHRSLLYPLEQLHRSMERGIDGQPGAAAWQEPTKLTEYVAGLRKEGAETTVALQQVQAALSYAENAEEYRKELISNITHELKTPLAVIHSYTESLQEGIAEEKKDHYLDVILSESERMDGMVLQMLDLSRLEAGKVKLTMNSFCLLKLVQSVTEKFAPLLEQKSLELTYGMAEDFLLMADEGRIEQVVTNLISNAYRYTEPGGKIRICVEVFSRQAQLVVANTAPPLSDETRERIWDSFYRAEASRTEKGTGLGLTLVKQIVELHGGSCQVENRREKGNETSADWVSFCITIPLG